MYVIKPRAWLITLTISFFCIRHLTLVAAQQQAPWGPCSLEAATSDSGLLEKIDVPAGPVGCYLVFCNLCSTYNAPGGQSSAIGSSGTSSISSATGVLQLASSSVLAGVRNSSLGRPAAVEIQSIGPEAAAAAAGGTPLIVPAGGTILLQDLLLRNATLLSPNGDPTKALLPAGLELPPGTLLKLRDVMLFVSQDILQQYIGFMLGVPMVTLLTDNVSFLHIRNYTSDPFGIVEARSVTLIAPEGARLGNVPLGVLRSIASSNSSAQQQQQQAAALRNPESIEAARGDAAGIVTVTDSYILGADNSTIIPLTQRLAGQQDSQQPLFMAILSNVTLAPRFWGPKWPVGGLVIRRPMIWAGSSWDSTSIDLGMQVGQIVLQGESANVTLINVELENLAYGDEQSSVDAEGNSILLSNQLWAFRYKRSVPRLVLWDVVLVIPEQKQIENVIYYVNAFNSEMDFWRNQTTFLRDTLRYTVIRYTRGRVPGDYIIITAYKKDQRMNNITYTSTPRVAPQLPLPVDPAIHQPLIEGQNAPFIGSVRTTTGLSVTLWNQRQGSCSRPHVLLLMLPDNFSRASNTSLGTAVSWAPGPLNVTAFAEDAAPVQAVAGQETSNSFGSFLPGAIDGSEWGVRPNTTLLEPLPVGDGIPSSWPPPGGEKILCPAQIRGSVQNSTGQSLLVDVNFTRSLFSVQPPESDPGAAVAAATAPSNAALLEFRDMSLIHLPQGPGVITAAAASGQQPPRSAAQPADGRSDGTFSSSSSSSSSSGGGSWVSLLPADAYAHHLWFVNRNFTVNGIITLTNLTMYVPPPEAAQMLEAAAAALQAAGGNSAEAVLSMVYPTMQGPLPVVYRAITVSNGGSAAAAAAGNGSMASSSRKRQLLQQQQQQQPRRSILQAAAAAAESSLLCIGNLQGLGVTGRNICLAAQPAEAPLPPGYFWPGFASSGGSSSSVPPQGLPPGALAGIIIAAAVTVLAIAGVALGVRRYRRRQQQPQLQQRQQQQLLSKSPDHPDDLVILRDLSSGTKRSTPLNMEGSVKSNIQNNNNSGSSDGVRALAQRLRDCCPGSSTDTTAIAAELSSTATSSAEAAAAAAAAAAKTGSSGNSARSLPAAATTTRRSSSEQKCRRHSADRQDSEIQAVQTGGTTVIVDLGEQLGRLAAMHKMRLSQSAFEDEEGDLNRRARSGQRSNLGQHTELLTAADEDSSFQDAALFMQRRQQLQQAATVARLSQAINSVSSGLQLRRLANSSLGLQSRYSAATGSGTTAAAASGKGSGAAGSSRIPTAAGPARQLSADKTRGDISRGVVLKTEVEGGCGSCGSEVLADQQGVLVGQAAAEPPQWPFADLKQPTGPTVALSSRDHRPVSTTSQGSSQGNKAAAAATASTALQLQLHEVIGSGTFGVVYRATWRGIPAAVKVVQLPGGSDNVGRGGGRRQSRREQMAVMETALGSSLSHPNIVQVYTHLLRPLSPLNLADDQAAAAAAAAGRKPSDSGSSPAIPDQQGAVAELKGSGSSATSNIPRAVGYELQLVMEYCPLGSLRSAIDACFLEDRLTGQPHYPTVLSLALGVSRAMHHLHSEGVIHGDLKAGNVLLKMEVAGSADGKEQPAVVAKVADFGLATTLDDTETHVSGVHRGTLTHMAPELLLQGRASRATDVYAMGILLWELATGQRAFADIPKAMLGAAVVRDHARPEWPTGSSCNHAVAIAAAAAAAAGMSVVHDVQPPLVYRQLTEACWAQDPADRPTFAEVSAALEYLLAQEQKRMAALSALTAPHQQQQQQYARERPTTAAAAAAPVHSRSCSDSGAGPVPGDTVRHLGSSNEPAPLPAAAVATVPINNPGSSSSSSSKASAAAAAATVTSPARGPPTSFIAAEAEAEAATSPSRPVVATTAAEAAAASELLSMPTELPSAAATTTTAAVGGGGGDDGALSSTTAGTGRTAAAAAAAAAPAGAASSTDTNTNAAAAAAVLGISEIQPAVVQPGFDTAAAAAAAVPSTAAAAAAPAENFLAALQAVSLHTSPAQPTAAGLAAAREALATIVTGASPPQQKETSSAAAAAAESVAEAGATAKPGSRFERSAAAVAAVLSSSKNGGGSSGGGASSRTAAAAPAGAPPAPPAAAAAAATASSPISSSSPFSMLKDQAWNESGTFG